MEMFKNIFKNSKQKRKKFKSKKGKAFRTNNDTSPAKIYTTIYIKIKKIYI